MSKNHAVPSIKDKPKTPPAYEGTGGRFQRSQQRVAKRDGYAPAVEQPSPASDPLPDLNFHRGT